MQVQAGLAACQLKVTSGFAAHLQNIERLIHQQTGRGEAGQQQSIRLAPRGVHFREAEWVCILKSLREATASRLGRRKLQSRTGGYNFAPIESMSLVVELEEVPGRANTFGGADQEKAF